MRLSRKDVLATVLVAAGVLLYVLWAMEWALTGMSGIRATGLVVLALGFGASLIAVVPTFDELLHGNKVYLAVTAALGLIAAVAGIQMLVASSAVGFAVLMGAMVALWLIATVHHSLLAKPAGTATRPSWRLPVHRSGSAAAH